VARRRHSGHYALVRIVRPRLLAVAAIAVAGCASETDSELVAVRWHQIEPSSDGETLTVQFFDPGCNDGYTFDHPEVPETETSVEVTTWWRSPPSEMCTMECPGFVHELTVELREPLAGRELSQNPAAPEHCSEGGPARGPRVVRPLPG
jgi:hypothetical protein